MIRFVYVGGQVLSGDHAFAFYDTVRDRFCDWDGEQLFSNVKDLEEVLSTRLMANGNVGQYERFSSKVWLPYEGHVVGMLDKLTDRLKNDVIYRDSEMFATQYLRQFIVQQEVELQVATTELASQRQRIAELEARLRSLGCTDLLESPPTDRKAKSP